MGLLIHVRIPLLILAALFGLAPGAGAQVTREYSVKAAFLYNFASFVEWPETAFAPAETAFVVGILGDDPFGNVLDEIVAGEKVKSRPLAIRRIRRVDEAEGCHILFVCASERRRVTEILNYCRSRPVLTVADLPDFAEQGGVVGFRTEDNRLKIDVNMESARAAGLTMSSKLLKLAHVIGGALP